MLNRVMKYPSLSKNILKLRECSSQKLMDQKRNFSIPQVLELNQAKKFSPGRVYEGFMCTRVENIKEFNMVAYLFQHETVGTEYLHIDREDTNVFSINFRTTPFDSTGVPHILEHNVLCGSVKYPVRDPFFKMLNRSVATFMNAMTGPDYTIYPFATTNEVDYRNLQKIYLDAVFQPNLRYIDFLQEGWRLEHTDLKDKKSPYNLKGVVYNEMKGAFSENSNVFGEHFLNKILPDHTYGYISGGDPRDIPNLTHTNLVEFHEKYYHPSNCRIFSYGHFKLEQTLKYINETYMKQYIKVDTDHSKIPSQKRWTESKTEHVTCRYDSMGAPIERQNQIAIGYLTNDVTNIYESFVMNVLTELLVRGPNSYFYKSLIEPNISGGYSQQTGYDNQLKDALFVVGLQDVLVDDFDKIKLIFEQTINSVIDKGFSKEHIESVLHNIEIQLKHQTPKFGLGLLFNLAPIWNHDGDVIQAMKISELIMQLRKNLDANPKYLQEKVEQYFKNNQHRLILTMSPDLEYEKKFDEYENELLKKKVAELTEDDKDKIYRDGIILADIQKSKENIDILPCLQLNDIKKDIEKINLTQTTIKNVPTNICLADTNDIVYYRGIFNAAKLTEKQKILLPLFTSMINQFGTKNYSYQEFDQLINTKTAGLNFSLQLNENLQNNQEYSIGIIFGSYALNKNTLDMFNIVKELLLNHKMIDIKRFEMLLENYISSLSVGIANSGHMYAMQCSSGLVTETAKLKESMSGIEHIAIMKELIKNSTSSEILEQLREIAIKLFDRKNLRSSINCDDKSQENIINLYTNFIESLPENDGTNITWNKSNILKSSCLQHTMNIPVNYCAKSIFTVPYQNPDFASLRILAKILSSKYLLPVVREQNGAYGAGAMIGNDGILNFFSYRDPNSIKTLEAFDNSSKWIDDNITTFDEQTLFEAKLGVLQKLDLPIGPGDKGMDNFRYGLTQEILRDHRNKILSINKDDLVNANEKYLKNTKLTIGKCILGPQNSDLLKEKDWIINKAE